MGVVSGMAVQEKGPRVWVSGIYPIPEPKCSGIGYWVWVFILAIIILIPTNFGDICGYLVHILMTCFANARKEALRIWNWRYNLSEIGAARIIWRNRGHFHYKKCSFWPQMTPKLTFLHIRITRYPYPKSWVFCTGIGYRVIPERVFLRVLGIRYLPVPEPKSSGIGYGCELGYTTLVAVLGARKGACPKNLERFAGLPPLFRILRNQRFASTSILCHANNLKPIITG